MDIFYLVLAFCQKECELLCVTCILDDGHRSHEINSVSDAVEKERNLITKAEELCKIIEEKLYIMKEEIDQGSAELYESAEKARVEITDLYNEIRKKLNKRETTLKQKVTEQLMKEETNLR